MDTNRGYERGLLSGILKYSRLHGPFSFWRKQNVVSGGPRVITLEMLKEWEPDVILWREGFTDINIKSLKLPVIYVPYTQIDNNLVNIVTDDAIGAKAAEHLIRRGFKNFAFYGLNDKWYFSKGRRQAFTETARKAGYHTEVFDRSRNEDLSEWLLSLKHPVGLMVCTDDCAVEVYDAVRKTGLKIPEDMAVIGVGNDELVCDFAHPPLSSVVLNLEHAGYEAAKTMVDLIKGKKVARNICVGALEVAERQSTSIFALNDKMISRAIQFIHSHIGDNLHVNDILRSVPLSRRVLYKRFQKALGRSIYEEIRRTKMDYAARMLTETSLSINEISEKLGFTDAKNLARLFYKEKGITPFKYRMQYSPYK